MVRQPTLRLTGPKTPESPLEGRGFVLLRPRLDLPVPADAARERYFAEVRLLIRERMVYPYEAALRRESGTVVLRFDLAKDGSVRCISIDRSSGVVTLDRAAVGALRDARLPPIPEGLGDVVSISATFGYDLQPSAPPGGAGSAPPTAPPTQP